ncbi:MAG: hypothetical protein ACKVWR_10555 [Acidimicrobiales bacterium]
MDTPASATATAARRPRRGGFPAWIDALAFPVLVFGLVGSVLIVVVWASVRFLGIQALYQPVLSFPGGSVLGGWVRYDGGWYNSIAREPKWYFYRPGQQSSVAFFPAYPAAMRLIGGTSPWHLFAGIAITAASGLGSAVLFYNWCRARLHEPEARLSVLVLLLGPYSYYLYGAVYADAFFLFFTLLAFTLVERDRPILAGLAAAVATASRPIGVAVMAALVLRVMERRRAMAIPAVDQRPPEGGLLRGGTAQVLASLRPELKVGRLRPGDAGVLLAGLGLGLWCLFLWAAFGDPFAFATVQGAKGWDQESSPRVWFKVNFFAHVLLWPRPRYDIGLWCQGILVLGAILLIPRVIRSFGWGYGAYVAGAVLVPIIGSKDMQGTGRYLLAAFPAFAAFGQLLREKPARTRRVWFAVSTTLMLIWCSLYARGYYVA